LSHNILKQTFAVVSNIGNITCTRSCKTANLEVVSNQVACLILNSTSCKGNKDDVLNIQSLDKNLTLLDTNPIKTVGV